MGKDWLTARRYIGRATDVESWRGSAIDWLTKINLALKQPWSVLFTSINILDSYHASKCVTADNWPELARASILIALDLSFLDLNPIQKDPMWGVSEPTHYQEQIRDILTTLDYDILPILPYVFLRQKYSEPLTSFWCWLSLASSDLIEVEPQRVYRALKSIICGRSCHREPAVSYHLVQAFRTHQTSVVDKTWTELFQTLKLPEVHPAPLITCKRVLTPRLLSDSPDWSTVKATGTFQSVGSYCQVYLHKGQIVKRFRHPDGELREIAVLRRQISGCLPLLKVVDNPKFLITVPYYPTRYEELNRSQQFNIWRSLTRALANLHNQGLIHGDIKTDNMVFTPEGTAVLIDFNTSVSTFDYTYSRMYAPLFRAPEVERGVVTPGADIYALAIVFVDLARECRLQSQLMKKAARRGVSAYGLIERFRRHRIDKVSDSEFRTLLLDMTQEDYSRRPTADQVLERLG